MSIRKVQLQWTVDLGMNFPNYINKMSLNMWRLLSWTFSEPSLKCSWKSSRSEANYFSQHSLNLLLNFKISARFYILILTWTLSPSFLPPFRVPSRLMARWSMACWEMPTAWSPRQAEWRILGSGKSHASHGKPWWSAAWSNGLSPARSHRTKVRSRNPSGVQWVGGTCRDQQCLN